MKKILFLITIMFWPFAGVAFSSVMSNSSFVLTSSALLSGGGVGGTVAASGQFILQSVKIGETAFGQSSNAQFNLNGGVILNSSNAGEKLMRVHVRGTIDDPSAIVYVNEVCAVNQGGSWIAPFVSIHEGENQFYINAFDPQENVSGTVVTVTVDTHPPIMPTAVFNSTTNISTQHITGTKEISGELWVRVRDQEILIPGFLNSITWSYDTALEEGKNDLKFFLIDEAGNKSAAFPVEIILDTDTAMFEIITPTDGTRTQSATIDIFGKLLDNTAQVSVNGAPVTVSDNSGFFTFENVLLPVIGANFITVHAVSITGFQQDFVINVFRDDQTLFPPTLNSIPSYIDMPNQTVGGSCDIDGGVQIMVSGVGTLANSSYGAFCAGGRWNRSLEFNVGENLIAVEGRDALGRMIAGEGAIVFLDVTPPTTPVVSDGGATQSSTTELRVSWFSYDRETAVTGFEYDFGTASLPPANLRFQTSNSTNVIASPLQMDQTYYVYVRAKNAAALWSAIGASDGIRISDNRLPMVLTLLPEVGEFRYPGESIDWQLVVHDPDDDLLQYKYSLNGQTAFHFSNSAKRTYQIPNDVFGRQNVSGVVRDDPQNTFQEWPSATTSFYVARRPLEP